jgi:hypothetical protein
MVVVMMLMMVGLFLNPPSEMEKIVHRAWQPKRAGGVVAINLVSFFQKPLEQRMVEKGYGNHKTLALAVFVLQPHLNCEPSFLHLHLLVLLHLFLDYG